jgi:hypothetical protein
MECRATVASGLRYLPIRMRPDPNNGILQIYVPETFLHVAMPLTPYARI